MFEYLAGAGLRGHEFFRSTLLESMLGEFADSHSPLHFHIAWLALLLTLDLLGGAGASLEPPLRPVKVDCCLFDDFVAVDALLGGGPVAWVLLAAELVF